MDTTFEWAKKHVVPVYVVYDRPPDYPRGFIARRWYGSHRDRLVFKASDLESLRNKLRRRGLVKLWRHETDSSFIVESWIDPVSLLWLGAGFLSQLDVRQLDGV